MTIHGIKTNGPNGLQMNGTGQLKTGLHMSGKKVHGTNLRKVRVFEMPLSQQQQQQTTQQTTSTTTPPTHTVKLVETRPRQPSTLTNNEQGMAKPKKHHVLAFRLKPSYNQQDWHNFTKLLFDTGAAIHICPPWFGASFGLFFNNDLPRVHGIDNSAPDGLKALDGE